MPIDIELFRNEETLKKVYWSQEARFKPKEQVDNVISADKAWRESEFRVNQLQKAVNAKNKEMSTIKVEEKKTKDPTDEQKKKWAEAFNKIQEDKKKLEEDVEKAKAERIDLAYKLKKSLNVIGNILPDHGVPIFLDEAKNGVEKIKGEKHAAPGKKYHHHELLYMIDGFEPDRGVTVAGHRAYYLKGPGVLLNQALINYGLGFLMKRGYTSIQPPFFMKKDIMAETAQLEEFDEALYHVKGAGDDEFYLIATSEQPISAFHRGETIHENSLPIRYGGISSCFRKEAGAHGKDVSGIFRIHQFEKVEQFVVCSPDKSWEIHNEMIQLSQDFYDSLGLSYQVISIVSGALNNAAAKKLDLEAWFPTRGVYRELVSCSNCTDYQSRAMDTKFQQAKKEEKEKETGGKSEAKKDKEKAEKAEKAAEKAEKKEPAASTSRFVHMLNGTLCATERTICCLLENYQTDEGVRVPDALKPYTHGIEFFKFVRDIPKTWKEQRQKEEAEAKAAEKAEKK